MFTVQETADDRTVALRLNEDLEDHLKDKNGSADSAEENEVPVELRQDKVELQLKEEEVRKTDADKKVDTRAGDLHQVQLQFHGHGCYVPL